MRDREPPGYDDWFDEPEPPTLEAGRGGRQPYEIPAETEEDVWVLPEDEPRRPRRGGRRGDIVIGGRALTTTQVAILAIAGLAIFIAILAAAGVFSSTPAPTTQTMTTQTTLPTTSTTPTTPTVKAPTQQLKQGDTGAQVKLLQKALTALGYSPGKADGSFGPATLTEVKDFQSAYGLTADGIVGTQTLAKLHQALQTLGG
jgi:Putative peptidoglycan binding domain